MKVRGVNRFTASDALTTAQVSISAKKTAKKKKSFKRAAMMIVLFALVAAAQAVQVAKRNFDMCTVCTGVVSEVKSMLLAGATVQQASDAMLDTGCLAFNDQQAEVSDWRWLAFALLACSRACAVWGDRRKKKKKKKIIFFSV
jgi:GMP synthase PP-ATPase subunit